ncbi:hypothetical protein CAPTEDRAFT_189487 [Capitella teleta]|uniref:Uncharacterized protein n=1 Tax=Capitella teleta TaxID=283909 RepID=R7V1G4_CAPTE|nr:hypothetical protein CAPTEDRAFT_189487 [Capitella teleta]|eukprot:ELU12342.1 hypothetical protein CAPTEDRAFT_189487 [Capitella teleta]
MAFVYFFTKYPMGEETEPKKMKNGRLKLLFGGLAMVVVLMTVVLNMRIGSSSHQVISDLLSSFSETEDDLLPHDMHELLAKKKSKAAVPKSHEHKDQVRFVLRENNLGAPEFIGKYKDTEGNKIEPHVDHIKERHDAFEVQLGNKKAASTYQYKGENTVAIGCAVTTRNQEGLKPDNMMLEMPFFKGLVSSFCLTATLGFNYHFYVAHDHYDSFFMARNDSHELFELAFYTLTQKTCAQGLNVSLHMVECNHSGNPAWAQNDAMMAAYMDNIAYYYRVNDDTLMESTGWTEKFIEELDRFNPPKVGVVGPWFKEGNIVILTHDFVHRTHVDIFGFYYPRVFTDWFADDWITGVYWPERTRKVPGTKVKHTMERGQRYVAHYEKANKVRVEVEIGKLILKRYLERVKNAGDVGTWNAESRNVISMSLFGTNIDLLYGALRYSQLVPIIFPAWRLRVYVEDYKDKPNYPNVLRIIVRKLENSGVEVIKLGANVTSILHPSLWRYLIADDLDVNYFIVRDANTRPSEREAAALEAWLQKRKMFYCVRDYPTHSAQGLIPSLVGGIPVQLKEYFKEPWLKIMASFKSDLEFLRTYLWPKIKSKLYCHDSVSCTQWPGAEAFPILRKENEFIGQRFDANDQIYEQDDVDILQWNATFIKPECVFVKNTGFVDEAVRAVIRHRPVFWSQDYHVTPIMDMKSLLTPIGVKIIDNSLSYYCSNVGTCAKDLRVIQKGNGMRLTPELIEQFYQAYRNDQTMKKVTTFVCTLPVAMCEAFTKFNKSMIIISTIRYEQARPEPEKWHALNRLLQDASNDPKSIVAANNLYDARYIEYFTGIHPPVVPNLCNYLKDSYRPSRKQFLLTPIHSTELYDTFLTTFDGIIMKKQIDLVLFPLREMYPQYLFSDIAAHPGIVYVPYQVSMVSMTEQYRMNIPLFFPTVELLAKWHVQYQVVRQRTWSGYMRKKTSQSAIPGVVPNVPDPNNDLDEDAVRYWLKFADYYQWPNIIYYRSIEDLVNKMLHIDLDVISQRMKVHNEKVTHEVKDIWSAMLLKVTEGKPMP